MLDPATILTILAYEIARQAGKDAGTDALAQLFGGAAGNFLHGDLQKLRTAFLTIAKPENNTELDRAAARSALHACLFCLTEALGESLEPATGTVARWRQCVEERLPQTLRDLRRPTEGFFKDADRNQVLEARKDCESRLAEIETNFTPVDIDPNHMLATVEPDYATQRATEALEAIEEKRGRLPDHAREIFRRQWFGYLCGSFQHEIQHNQPVANILSNISLARLHDKVDRILEKLDPLAPTSIDPFATVPPLPAAFIDRLEISGSLREKLLAGSGTVGLTAVAGMGGVGKTIVALGLCHDQQVREHFPDGIVWVTIGKETNVSFEDRVKHLAQSLNQQFRVYNEATYQSLLSNKAVLVVLDDVWKLSDVEPFLLAPGRSRLLYTSRDQGLAGPLGADNHQVDVLDDAQARRFLSRWSGRENQPLPEPSASGILNQAKGLALALAMIGAVLRGKPNAEWANQLANLEKARLKQVGVRPANYRYESLYASIAVSVNALDDIDKARYLKLAVLLEDMPAPVPLLRCLWGGNEQDVQSTMLLLVDRSLAQREADGSIRLHDLQLDYVRGEHPDQEALALQHSALLLSFHVVRPHPEQFAGQMTGRLLAHQAQPSIAAFLKELDSNAPRTRLQPLWVALTPAGGPMLRVLEGHTNFVFAVALTADGKRAVSGSQDHTLRVWDLEGNQLPRVLEGHTERVGAVALTADGKRVVSGSIDHTLRVWDLEGNQPPRVLEGHTAGVLAVALTADGKRAISGSKDNTLRVWDLDGFEAPRVLEDHTDAVMAVALTADGKRAVSGSADHTLRVWDLEGIEAPRVLNGHTATVRAVALSVDGKRAISGSVDKTLRVWDLEGNQPPRVLEGHTHYVSAVALTADGKRAVSCSNDHTIRVWDLEGNEAPRVIESHTSFVIAVALTSDGKRFVSGYHDQTLRVWDLECNQPPRVLEGHIGRVNAVALTADGKHAVSGSSDKTLRVWDLVGNQPPRVLRGHTASITGLALAADGSRAVSGSNDKTLRVWDLEGNQSPRVLEVLEVDTLEITAVALTADGKRAVSVSHHGGFYGNMLRVWDLVGDQPPRVLRHVGWVEAVALTADGKRAVSGSSDKTLRVWDLEGNQPPRVLEGHSAWVGAVALTADGKRAVSGSFDHTLRVWDVDHGTCLVVFTCDAPINCCAWAEGRIIAGDSGGQVHLFAWEE
jgi:WD40 repeat protein